MKDGEKITHGNKILSTPSSFYVCMVINSWPIIVIVNKVKT